MWQFLKNWTLPLAMLAGVLVYFCFSYFSFLDPLKPSVRIFASWLTPVLIFMQLLITFCKVEFRDLVPRPWTIWLLLFQLMGTLSLAIGLANTSSDSFIRIVLEGGMVCIVCPTATAAAVVTGKLGGSPAALTTYTLLSNILAAVLVPLLFPLVEPSDIGFGEACGRILGKVFPLLICPFVLAWLLRCFFSRAHRRFAAQKDLAFYLWAVALIIVMAQTTETVVEGEASLLQMGAIALVALVICVLLFMIGKQIGGRYADRISGGQALGQKNTILAIWMAGAYLNPLAALAPGSYVLWQNIINSWQLWKKRRCVD